MDNIPINLENILEQAPKWTFAGDYKLLQWMNQISKDLETRATKTTDDLAKLNNNIRSTNVALDNVANSLTTLQFGNQFVECRVQDDDETIMNTNEASSDEQNETKHTLSSKEMLNIFLENNLKVLRNCHEKYSIDLDDSDEDDEGKSKEKTCIYQPINPYNDKPLPFIFGSKDWHAKWHVGLYENQEENSYSGDEISEAFSESSSSTHLDDNESFESNTEWASSYSIDNENFNTNIEVKNASSLRGSQSLYPGTKSLPINAAKNKSTVSESSSLSTPSSSLAKKSTHNLKPSEISSQRSESVNSLNSKNASRAIAKEVKVNNSQNKTQPQKVVDLFAEPPGDLEETTSSSSSSIQHKIQTEINKHIVSSGKPSTFRTQPPPFVDLFAEPPEDIPSSTASSISSGLNIKRKTINLFDDDDQDVNAKDDLFSVLTTKKDELVKPHKDELVKSRNDETKNLPPVKSISITKTPKSLFEDSDDEDDDFLNTFVKKSSSKEVTKTSLTKTLLFDDEFNKDSFNTNTIPSDKNIKEKDSNKKIEKLFNDSEVNNDDVKKSSSKELAKTSLTKTILFDNELNKDFLNKNSNPSEKRISGKDNDVQFNKDDVLVRKNSKDEQKLSSTIIENNSKLIKDTKVQDKLATEKVNKNKIMNLFDDLEDEPIVNNLQPKEKPKKINLFDDLEDDGDDDGDDIFSIEPKQNTKDQTNFKRNNEENILKDGVKKSIGIDENKNVHSEESVKKSLTNIANVQKLTSSFEEFNKSSEIEIQHEVLNQNQTINKAQEVKQQKDRENPSQENNDLEDIVQHETEEKAATDTISLENHLKPSISSNSIPDQKEFNNNENVLIAQEKAANISTKDISKSNATNKYDFNSILFLDEPPEDDNEFFETLTKTPQALNSNYNTIDLEHDIYEPELPKIPGPTTSNNQKDVTENKQTSLYTGLQLFSDIPPDDDTDGDDNGENNASNVSADVNQTKRLHSVFYDDFDETLMALNKNQIHKEIPKHSIFSDEPPPISAEDTLDHKLPDVKTDVLKEDVKLKGSDIVSKLQESLTKSEQNTDTIVTAKRPVSKLQMPHININVQALLPGANNTLRKAKDDNTKSNITDKAANEEKTKINISTKTTTIEKETIVESHRTVETEHILPSVTKNRVRAPAARRPSTRRARQENYRKSLIEEQQIFEGDHENKETQNDKESLKTMTTNIPKNIQEEQTINTKSNKKEVEKSTKPSTSILFEDKSQINSNILDPSKSLVNEKSKSDTEQIKSNIENLQNVEIKTKTTGKNTSLLFEGEDDDYDLFKHIKSSKTNDNKTPINFKENELKLPIQTPKQIDEYNGSNNKNIEVTKEILNTDSPTVTSPLSKVDNTQQQPLKSDGNLFNEINENKISKTNKIETKITQKQPANEAKSSSFLDDEDDDDDLFKTSIQKPQIYTSIMESNSKAKSQFKSFLDSESDEDLKVAGLPTTSSSIPPKTSSSTKTPTVKEPLQKHKDNKLFNDSDTDSDDLFEKLSTNKSSNNKISTQSINTTKNKKQPQTSLFSDVSDDDDENFIKSSNKVIKNPEPKSVLKVNKTQIKKQTNASLFSDIDSDEDDLFGSGSAKVNTKNDTQISTVKIPSTSKTSATPKTNTAPTTEMSKPKTLAADNPLADLL